MTGNELQVKGLDGEITAVGENLAEEPKNIKSRRNLYPNTNIFNHRRISFNGT